MASLKERKEGICNEGGCSATFHGKTERDEPCEEENGPPVNGPVGLVDGDHPGQNHGEGSAQESQRDLDPGEREQDPAEKTENRNRCLGLSERLAFHRGEEHVAWVLRDRPDAFPRPVEEDDIPRAQNLIRKIITLLPPLSKENHGFYPVVFPKREVAKGLSGRRGPWPDHDLCESGLFNPELLHDLIVGYRFEIVIADKRLHVLISTQERQDLTGGERGMPPWRVEDIPAFHDCHEVQAELPSKG